MGGGFKRSSWNLNDDADNPNRTSMKEIHVRDSHRRWRDIIFTRFYDDKGRRIIRPGSPLLFVITMLCLIWVGYRTNTVSCNNYRHLDELMKKVSVVLEAGGKSIRIRERGETSPVLRKLDQQAYLLNRELAQDVRSQNYQCSRLF